MAINFTEPSRKNVTVQLESQAKTELSSTIGGESVKIDVNRPSKFKTPSISDAIDLNDILETASIRFEASSAGYTSGDYVSSWTNLGSATNRDLSNPTKAGLDTTKPIFDIGGADNPFVDGAMKFVLDADIGTNESDYLEFDSRLTNDGEFTMYMVVSRSVSSTKTAVSPVWVNSAVREGNSSPVFIYLKTTNAFGFLGSEDGDASNLNDIINSYGDSDMTSANGDVIILVVTRDSNDQFSFYDYDADGFVNEKKGVGFLNAEQMTRTELNIDSFGARTTGEGIEGGVAFRTGVAGNYVDGDAIYVAEWGYWNSNIGGQQAAALGRLLKQKYQVL